LDKEIKEIPFYSLKGMMKLKKYLLYGATNTNKYKSDMRSDIMDFDVMSIVGKVFDSNNFGQFKVIRYVSMDRHRKNRLYEVEFLDQVIK
jgi:hypothetical protein